MAVSEPAGSSWAAPGRAGSVPGSEPGPPGAPGAGCGPGPCWAAVLACLSLACCYVGSLYVWGSPLPRDHPSVIKRRFTSVLLVSGLAPALVWLWREHSGIKAEWSLPALLGLRLEGLLPATLLPLLLTMVLFLGPLIQLSMDCSWRWSHGLRAALAPRSWLRFLGDVRWLRNQVVAPVTEELVFRACMLPMLLPCAGHRGALLACPLFFALAHFHHVIEQLRFRQGSLGSILVAAAFQFSYTAVFGAYTAFIFLRTGHLAGPVVCHSFCNALGFPALGAALGHPRRGALLPCYLGGVLLFLLLLRPLTHPPLFGGAPPRPRPRLLLTRDWGDPPCPPLAPDPGLGGSPLPPPSPDPGLGGPPLLTLTRDWGDPPCPPLAPDPGIGGTPPSDPDPGLGGSPLAPPCF